MKPRRHSLLLTVCLLGLLPVLHGGCAYYRKGAMPDSQPGTMGQRTHHYDASGRYTGTSRPASQH